VKWYEALRVIEETEILRNMPKLTIIHTLPILFLSLFIFVMAKENCLLKIARIFVSTFLIVSIHT
jgi:hypothetical protein